MKKKEKQESKETLRDRFAMAALTGLISMRNGMRMNDVAKVAYAYADAMLAERKKVRDKRDGKVYDYIEDGVENYIVSSTHTELIPKEHAEILESGSVSAGEARG